MAPSAFFSAFTLGLVVVGVQSQYSQVENELLTEASKVGDLYRDFDGLDEPDRLRLQNEVRNYVDSILLQQWPANNRNEQSQETIILRNNLARHVIQLHPTSASALVVQAALIQDVDDMLDAMQRRVFLGQASTSPIMWSILTAGLMITLGLAAMFPMRRIGRQIALMSLAAMMFAMMIFLVVAMDRPMHGCVSVQPDAFRMIKQNILVMEKGR